jgi:hypothetical protein
MELLARFGFGARGLVYVVVGALAALAAVGEGGGTGGSKSALGTLMRQPFGAWIVAGLGLGLAAFALWRVVEAVTDADRRGSEPKGLAIRGAHLVSGVAYAGLAIAAGGMALGRRGVGSEDAAARSWTGWLLSQPFGRWLVAAIAFAIIGTGIGYAWRAWRGRVTDRLALPPGQADWATAMGRFGFAARGLVFVLIGGFLVMAAWRASSGEVKGLGGALELLREQPYGAFLLLATALGLAAFGAFGLVQARYRRVDAPDVASLADKARIN